MRKRLIIGLWVAFVLGFCLLGAALQSAYPFAAAICLCYIALQCYIQNIRIEEFVEAIDISAVPVFAGCLGIGLISAALILVPAGQAFIWLKTGHWPSLTLANVIAPLLNRNAFGNWLTAPHSWFGLHNLVNKMVYEWPLFLWIFGLWAGAVEFAVRKAK